METKRDIDCPMEYSLLQFIEHELILRSGYTRIALPRYFFLLRYLHVDETKPMVLVTNLFLYLLLKFNFFFPLFSYPANTIITSSIYVLQKTKEKLLFSLFLEINLQAYIYLHTHNTYSCVYITIQL